MFSAYILPYESKVPVLFIFAVYLMILGALGNLLWAFAGNVLKTLYGQHYRIMNGIMALLSGLVFSEDCRCVVNKKDSVLSEREYRAFVFILTDFCFLRTALIVPVLPLTSDTAPQY